MTFSCLFGLLDPLRPRVQKIIKYAHKGALEVRLISGDHVATAKAVAQDAGILDVEDVRQFTTEDEKKYIMNAKDFKEIVGDIVEEEDDDHNKTYRLENQEKFDELAQTLRVIGRANPEHKRIFAVGLQANNKKVAVVGDGINDVEVFKQADVSFAMNSGCDMARDNCSFILADNDFDACMRAVMYGRNIYNNVRRFLQFQITVNFAVIITVFLGSIFLTQSPFTPTMLLWINMIMDLLAALSLATEPPQASIIHQKPITNEEIILNKVIWRQIYSIVLW